jgi:O-antigen/teichoic acid export membrane protein
MSGAGFYLLRFLLTGMASIGINLYVMAAYPVHDVGYLAILFIVAATVVQLADLGIGAALIQSRSVVDDVLATQLFTNLLALWAPLLVVVCAAAVWWPSPLLLMSAVLVLTIPITAIRLLSSATLEQRFGFAAVASLDLAETAALVTVVFISAWWGIGVWGYVLGCVARAVIGWAIAGKLRAFKISLIMPRWDATWRSLLRFGLWFHAGTILTAFRALVLPVSLASLIGLTAVAIVDRSIFIASAPAVILGTIQQRVLFPFFSATQDVAVRHLKKLCICRLASTS